MDGDVDAEKHGTTLNFGCQGPLQGLGLRLYRVQGQTRIGAGIQLSVPLRRRILEIEIATAQIVQSTSPTGQPTNQALGLCEGPSASFPTRDFFVTS